MREEARDDEARLRQLAGEALAREVEAVEVIAAGLGSRRFYRLRLAGSATPHSVVGRVECDEDPGLRPPGVPPEPPLEPVRALLARHGLPVPACYGQAPGLCLLEDVGNESLEQAALTRSRDEVRSLYREACGLVPRLQAIPPVDGHPSFARRLDDALFRYKAEQVVEWVLPQAHDGAPAPAAEAEAVREAFRFVAEIAQAAPQRLAHRDFKAANLHLHRNAATGDRLTLIDLQGAFLAPPEYDLVCLLRDSHVALDEDSVRSALDEVRPRLPDAPGPGEFARRFGLLTLTRNGKDLARYLYAARTRGDARYLRLVPRAVATLQRAARDLADADPRIARLAEILARLPESPCAE